MKLLASIAAITILLTATSYADQLKPGQIPADAKWFAHVDMEGIMSIPMVQEKMQHHHEKKHAKHSKWSDKMGFDPMQDLLSATLYSNQYDGYDAVLLMHVRKIDREKMLAAFKEKHPDHTVEKVEGRDLYNWTRKHHGKEMKLSGVIANDNLIIIGSGKELVKSALAASQGKGDLMTNESPLLAGLSDTTVFASRALDVPADYQATTRCPVLRACGEAFVQWTESDGNVTANYELSANDQETANQFRTIVAGMVAMMKLKQKNGQASENLLDGLQYGADGTRFSLNLETTVDEIEAAMKEMHKHKRHHRHGGKHHDKNNHNGNDKAEDTPADE